MCRLLHPPPQDSAGETTRAVRADRGLEVSVTMLRVAPQHIGRVHVIYVSRRTDCPEQPSNRRKPPLKARRRPPITGAHPAEGDAPPGIGGTRVRQVRPRPPQRPARPRRLRRRRPTARPRLLPELVPQNVNSVRDALAFGVAAGRPAQLIAWDVHAASAITLGRGTRAPLGSHHDMSPQKGYPRAVEAHATPLKAPPGAAAATTLAESLHSDDEAAASLWTFAVENAEEVLVDRLAYALADAWKEAR